MAVAPDRIKARLRQLFPKANLSKTRLDALAAKLSQKPADDADDAAIDEVLTTANDFHSFEDIAKDDDRIRTLEANKPQTPPANPGGTPAEPNTPTPQPDDTPAWAKAILQKVETLEQKQAGLQAQTQKEKFVAQAIAKGIPADLAHDVQVGENFNPDEAVTALEAKWTGLRQLAVNAQAGDGRVPQGQGGNGKEASKEEVDALVNDIM